jgi:hypothetical protein
LNQRRSTTWLRWGLWSALWLGYSYFAWQNAAVLLVRHLAMPQGSLGLDLQACLLSERPEIRLAAAQRVADYSGDVNEIAPIVRKVWSTDVPTPELGWFLAQAIARMDDKSSDLMVMATIDGFDSAIERFKELPANQQTDALLSVLEGVDLESERGAIKASAIVHWLGYLGENATGELAAAAEADGAPRTVSSIQMNQELAATVATKLLDRYQDYELPPAVESALVQLGKPAVAAICQQLGERLRPDVPFAMRMGLYRTLIRLGPLANDAVPTLLRAIEFEPVNHAFVLAMKAMIAAEPSDRTAVANAIRNGMVAERWKSTGYSLATIEAACQAALLELGDNETIDALIAELQGQRANEAGVRIKAIDAPESWQSVRRLGQYGPRAERAKQILTEGLKSLASSVRIEAAWALVKVGGDAELAAEVLASFLDPTQSTPEDIGLALIAIAEIGWPTEWPAEPLLRLLETGISADVRSLSSNVLHKTYPDDIDLTNQFVSRLVAEPDIQVRRVIMRWLEVRLGGRDTPNLATVELPQAVQWLRDNWSDSGESQPTGERELQVWLAVRTLRVAGPEGAVALAEWLAEDPECPKQANELFDGLGEARRAALPILQKMLRSSEQEIAKRAVVRLGLMGILAVAAYQDVAETEFPESAAALQAIDPRAYVAGTSRQWEWAALWLTPILLVVGGVVDWGWTKSRMSAIMPEGNLSGA